MKVQLKGWIVCTKYAWNNDPPKFDFYTFKVKETEDTTILREETVEFEVPDDYDPTQAKIDALLQMKKQLQARLAQDLMELDQKIGRLTALPNGVK